MTQPLFLGPDRRIPQRGPAAFLSRAAILTLVLIILAALPALGQQATIYKDGKAVGRSTKDTQGTTTLYGRDGRAVVRESNGVLYDAQTGKVVGTIIDSKKGK